MLRKQFHIGKSQTKSRISFAVPEVGPHRSLKRSLFRDPAAIPMLQDIARALESKGYHVTQPTTGKACYGWFEVPFPNVEIGVFLLVRRRKQNIEFEIWTSPSQTFRQRLSAGTMKSPDCPEWAELCSAIYSILAADQRVKLLTLKTFAEAHEE